MKPPLIVVGPDVPQGERRDAFVYLQDIMATTLDLAGIDKPMYVDFNSLRPLLGDASGRSVYPEVYGAFNAKWQRMIRSGDHKLILYPEVKVVRLYNIAEDPLETRDLAGNPEVKPLIRRLFRSLQKLQQEMDDPLDLSVAYPELARH
jgi:arylsulfatase A-like enzyme